MLLIDAEQRGREIILSHYDSLLIELFGVRAAGLPRSRVERLIEQGYLSPRSLRGFDVAEGSSDEPLNPILFVRRIGRPYIQANSQERDKMRRWSLERWRQEITAPQTGVDPRPLSLPAIERPTPDMLTPPPLQGAIPDSFSTAEMGGLVSAFRSTGGYIRGLGLNYADEFSASVYEEWDGEQLLSTSDPQQRAERLKIIRDEVGTAVLTKSTAQEVARRIRQRTGDLARNFDRIAETELQAVHNEGQIFLAVEIDGDQARVARIPEGAACSSCKALFLDEDGKPRIFSVSELAANGSNVGRRRQDWVATAYPIHPHCRCDTIAVGPNQRVTTSGRIVSDV